MEAPSRAWVPVKTALQNLDAAFQQRPLGATADPAEYLAIDGPLQRAAFAAARKAAAACKQKRVTSAPNAPRTRDAAGSVDDEGQDVASDGPPGSAPAAAAAAAAVFVVPAATTAAADGDAAAPGASKGNDSSVASGRQPPRLVQKESADDVATASAACVTPVDGGDTRARLCECVRMLACERIF